MVYAGVTLLLVSCFIFLKKLVAPHVLFHSLHSFIHPFLLVTLYFPSHFPVEVHILFTLHPFSRSSCQHRNATRPFLLVTPYFPSHLPVEVHILFTLHPFSQSSCQRRNATCFCSIIFSVASYHSRTSVSQGHGGPLHLPCSHLWSH